MEQDPVQGLGSGIVYLNVGGKLFTTSIHTLTREPTSMLARLCNSSIPTVTDKNGNLFIDRQAKPFFLVIQYLSVHVRFLVFSQHQPANQAFACAWILLFKLLCRCI